MIFSETVSGPTSSEFDLSGTNTYLNEYLLCHSAVNAANGDWAKLEIYALGAWLDVSGNISPGKTQVVHLPAGTYRFDLKDGARGTHKVGLAPFAGFGASSRDRAHRTDI